MLRSSHCFLVMLLGMKLITEITSSLTVFWFVMGLVGISQYFGETLVYVCASPHSVTDQKKNVTFTTKKMSNLTTSYSFQWSYSIYVSTTVLSNYCPRKIDILLSTKDL